MTDAERAVIDAARAWAADYTLSENVSRLLAAVRSLPRPLSEQLPEIRPGAVVVQKDGLEVVVLANLQDHKTLIYEHAGEWWHGNYSSIRRIISNPEADRG